MSKRALEEQRKTKHKILLQKEILVKGESIILSSKCDTTNKKIVVCNKKVVHEHTVTHGRVTSCTRKSEIMERLKN